MEAGDEAQGTAQSWETQGRLGMSPVPPHLKEWRLCPWQNSHLRQKVEAKSRINREMVGISDMKSTLRGNLVRKRAAFSHQHFVAQVHLMVITWPGTASLPLELGDVKMSLALGSWPRVKEWNGHRCSVPRTEGQAGGAWGSTREIE